MSGERSTTAMLMDHTHRWPGSWYDIQLNDRVVHVLEEFMLEVEATKGHGLLKTPHAQKQISLLTGKGHPRIINMIYKSTRRLDRLLNNGQKLLSYIGHGRAKVRPGTFRPRTPIDTTICNVCRHSLEVRNYKQPQ
jgi:hypothetical protein